MLFDPARAEQLAEAIRSVATSSARRSEMVRAGRALAVSRTPDALAEQYRVMYEHMLARHTTATAAQPQLATRRISPHIIRHTTAMHLLQAGVDISVIALWLGHESPTTTHQYVEADLAMKEQALGRLQEPDAAIRRYKAPDSLIEFLKTL